MILIDTHAHVYLEEFDEGRAAMLERAVSAGVEEILMPAIDSSEHANMLRLEFANPETCRSMMGLHPCYVKENYLEELAIVRSYFEQRPFVAVGEIGLDFYWDKTFTDQQYKAFHQQIEWALEYEIPIAIHSRNATDECIEVVRQHQEGKLRGVFHCFSGDVRQAREIMELGFYLGIGGVLTFKNAGLDKVIAEVGLSRVVLETDAPYLAPVPYRGKTNEPSYLQYVANKLVDVSGMMLEDVATVTTENARELFGLRK